MATTSDRAVDRLRRDVVTRKPARGLVDDRDCVSQPQHGTARLHLGQQHADDVLGAVVAEELAERLFVPGDAVLFDQRDEVVRRVARQRRLGRNAGSRRGNSSGSAWILVKLQRPPPEMRIFSPGALAWSSTSTARPRLPASIGAHHAGGTGANDHHVIFSATHTILFRLPLAVASQSSLFSVVAIQLVNGGQVPLA